MSKSEDFYKWFETVAPKLGNREISFRKIFKYLDNQPSPIIIVETGCLRKVDNFLDQPMIAKLPFPYNPAGLPEDVYRAIQSQYGNKTFGPYDLDKQRTVINYYKGLV